MKTELKGIVRARRYNPDGEGKQFLGAAIECADGRVWLIAYDEQSPFHAFDGCEVVASGEPYEPSGQVLIGWNGEMVGHFRVATMRSVAARAEAEIEEVGPERHLSGRFESQKSDTGESMLLFISGSDSFSVANDPPGVEVGPRLDVVAYPVRLSQSRRNASRTYLWIVCPSCSSGDIWEWRRRRS
jgi:hypothetical protein